MTTGIDIPGDGSMDTAALVRLLHLSTPSLPTGGFAYSQGLEWAIESGWIKTVEDLETWLEELLFSAMAKVDIPLFARLYQAVQLRDVSRFRKWTQVVTALRETSELRQEEKNRGRALGAVLKGLDNCPLLDNCVQNDWYEILVTSQLAGFSFASAAWQMPLTAGVTGYVWGWLENQALAGIKIIPLGQTSGQKMLMHLGTKLPSAVKKGLALEDDQIGCSLPAFAIAGCSHEIQHTRLFRS